MKLPKGIQLNTTFWASENPEKWRENYEKLLHMFALMGIIIILAGFRQTGIVIVGILMIIVSFLGVMSKNRWRREVRGK